MKLAGSNVTECVSYAAHGNVLRPLSSAPCLNGGWQAPAQRGDGSGLALESRAELIVHDLDRDEAVEAGISRLVDMAHTAGTE